VPRTIARVLARRIAEERAKRGLAARGEVRELRERDDVTLHEPAGVAVRVDFAEPLGRPGRALDEIVRARDRSLRELRRGPRAQDPRFENERLGDEARHERYRRA